MNEKVVFRSLHKTHNRFIHQVTASGPGLEPTGVTVMKWAEFTVDTRQASKPRSKVPLHISALDKDMDQVEVIVKVYKWPRGFLGMLECLVEYHDDNDSISCLLFLTS